MTSGIKRSVSLQTESLNLVKKITSGSMVQVLAVPVLRFTMIVEKNMAAANQAVQ